MLELMKELLEIDLIDSTKDHVLNHFLKKACEVSLGYCNVSELPDKYDDTIVDFAVYLYRNRNNTGLIQKREGEKNATFEIGVPEEIKLALPPPKIKVGGY
ncbi:phage head-tail connector protein [Natronincola ferrireducens]|uniref:Phage gp6-like head-tail connector protein n=1 Tax=Natronincola ferrireducens TaxID=393762 RepID=A0A1G9II17_9FIRM|nr:phage head-tail connector protein [Natronincola ferrireducens]SDL24574.1 Phage gp6-like head-tail connector protein [Natronincola ferrireducens]